MKDELTYAQWEAYLAIHLNKDFYAYIPAMVIDKLSTNQSKHINALRVGRYYPTPCTDSGTIVADVVRYFEKKTDHFKTKLPLLPIPSPLDFEEYLAKKRELFIGRQWVFNAIEEWRKNPNAPKVFLITGDPGIGKSALGVCRIGRELEK